MNHRDAEPHEFAELRRRAEAHFQREVPGIGDMSPEEVGRTIHELRMHQIELEMQNEELRRAQVELTEARDGYADLYDFAPVGYLTICARGLIVQANLTLAEMLHVERGSLVNERLSRFILAEDQDVYYLWLKDAMETGAMQKCEIRLRNGSRDVIWAQLVCARSHDIHAPRTQFRSALIDIGERKRAEEDARKSQEELERRVAERTAELTLAHETLQRERETLHRTERLASLGTFVAGLAHEINNPLAALVTSSHAAINLKRKPGEEAKLERCLQNIVQSVTRCSEVLDKLRRFTHQESAEKVTGDLNEVIRRAAESVGMFADDQQVTIELTLQHDIPHVLFNVLDIELLMTNLILNSMQAATDRVCVQIRTELASDRVRLQVQDNGCGPTEEAKRRCFEPFYSTRREQGGMGLGLSIAHGIVTDHGGSIQMDGEWGTGSTVTVQLPRAPDGIL